MLESKAQAVGVCTQTTQGTHVLYRGFGCNRVDDAMPPMKRYILEQLSSFYPDIKLSQISVYVNERGEYQFKVDIGE